MTIWAHAALAREATIEAVGVTNCIFCGHDLCTIHSEESNEQIPAIGIGTGPGWATLSTIVTRCSSCGWWSARKRRDSQYIDHAYVGYSTEVYGAAGCLKRFDLADVSVQTEYIRDYLTGRYEDRFTVHPRKFEEVVTSVFRDVGYEAVTTNYSGDDGIDVILRQDASTIGVQVKRYKGSIGVHQIRELAGSLMLGGMTKGIFVTTSTFQSGAADTASRFAMQGYPIDLMDATRFYSVLEIAQAKHHAKYEQGLVTAALSNMTTLQHEGGRSLP